MLGLSSNETAYEQAFNLASNILTQEVVANPESVTEDIPYEDQDILNFFKKFNVEEEGEHKGNSISKIEASCL